MKSKRIVWDLLDLGGGRKGEVGDGFVCDFEVFFGMFKFGVLEMVEVGDKIGDIMDVDEDVEGGVKVVDMLSLLFWDLCVMFKVDFI